MKAPSPLATRSDVADMELGELEAVLEAQGCERYHARQIYRWIYRRGTIDFNQMTDLSRELRARLAGELHVSTPARRHARDLDGRDREASCSSWPTVGESNRCSSRTIASAARRRPARARRQPLDCGRRSGRAEPAAGRAGDVLHLDAGGLRDDLPLLPDGQDGTGRAI